MSAGRVSNRGLTPHFDLLLASGGVVDQERRRPWPGRGRSICTGGRITETVAIAVSSSEGNYLLA